MRGSAQSVSVTIDSRAPGQRVCGPCKATILSKASSQIMPDSRASGHSKFLFSVSGRISMGLSGTATATAATVPKELMRIRIQWAGHP